MTACAYSAKRSSSWPRMCARNGKSSGMTCTRARGATATGLASLLRLHSRQRRERAQDGRRVATQRSPVSPARRRSWKRQHGGNQTLRGRPRLRGRGTELNGFDPRKSEICRSPGRPLLIPRSKVRVLHGPFGAWKSDDFQAKGGLRERLRAAPAHVAAAQRLKEGAEATDRRCRTRNARAWEVRRALRLGPSRFRGRM
jgi:hypothetical protein